MVRNSGKIKEVVFASSTIKLRNVHFLTVTGHQQEQQGRGINQCTKAGDRLQ